MQVKKKRNLIFANVFLLLVLAAGATYAWFALNTTANVDINEVRIIGPGELQMTIADNPNEQDWSPYLLISESDDLFKELKMIDVTGEGNGTFYRPKSVGNDGQPAAGDAGTSGGTVTWINVSDGNTTETTNGGHDGANKDYIRINLKLRATTPKSGKNIKVSLKPGSKLETVASPSNLQNDDDPKKIENKSTFGNFSKDYVVGGMRVSAVTVSGESRERKFTWIPRTDVMLKVDSDAQNNNTYQILTDTRITGADATEVITHKYVSPSDSYNTTILDNNSVIAGQIEDTTQNTELVTLTGTNYSGYKDGEVTLYIWLEGCDTEARRALVGGRFRLNLLLDTEEV